MQADCILVGGGLANTLIALRLIEVNPRLRLRVIERGGALGGNHIWCFHETDISPRDLAWLRPLIVNSWESQEVVFGGVRRVLRTGYHAISSKRLHEFAMTRLAPHVMLEADAETLDQDSVTLTDGTQIDARCVIDGRGLPDTTGWCVGYQKFLGLEVSLRTPCSQTRPIIMDATVAQTDGFRFVYILPLSSSRLLIEDTCYSNNPAVDITAIEAQIHSYAESRGWRISEVVRREIGVLPVVLDGNIEPLLGALHKGPALSGSRAGLFHPTTAYSLPDAVRLTQHIAAQRHLTTRAIARLVSATSRNAWKRRGFYRLLNRLLLQAAQPHERVRVMDRFYGLPEPLIERFYADRLTATDKARILVGKPPISISSALKVVRARRRTTGEVLHGRA